MHTTERHPARVDQRAVEAELVSNHLPLVQHIVVEMASRLPQHVSRDDLVSAGMLGLAQATRSYDSTLGVNFDRHAANRIRGALLDELRSIDWASRSVRASARRLQAADEKLTGQLGRSPSTSEIAGELGVASSDIHKLVNDVHRATVLNYESVIADGDAEDLLSTDDASPDEILLERERLSYLHDAISALPDRLQAVVRGYFFEERLMQELADELGVTESRISQLRAQALLLLRDGMNAHLDPEKLTPERRPDGCAAKRKQAYYAEIATQSDFRARLDTPRAAETVAAGVA